MRLRAGIAIGAALLASACVRVIPEGPQVAGPAPVETPAPVASPTPEPSPTPATARLLGLAAGPSVESLAFDEADAAGALASFRESCPKLLARGDVSGMTRTADWELVCQSASNWRGGAREFFATLFETIRVGDGAAFATGYFEPEIAGSRTRRVGYDQPVYGMPRDLERAWPADVPEAERTGRPPLGRYDETGAFVPYFERSEIMAGALLPSGTPPIYQPGVTYPPPALNGRAPVLAWAADPVEFFFLQIQGSGMLRLPDGNMMRIGYAGQNGREYTGIGRVMREAGMIGDGTPYPTSMQGIMAYIRANPEQGREVMNLNKSWIFFRELTTDGPLGALEVPVRGRSSVAVDPNYVTMGAPVFLDMVRDEADGLWIAQDTGGAIKGANRFDTFWGNGPEARQIAGGMSSRGTALVLVPRGTLAFHGLR